MTALARALFILAVAAGVAATVAAFWVGWLPPSSGSSRGQAAVVMFFFVGATLVAGLIEFVAAALVVALTGSDFDD